MRPFGLTDHAALLRPTLVRAIREVRELACRLSGPLGTPLGLPHLRRELGDETLVAGEPEHVLHVVGLAPRHQLVATEAGVGANDNRRRWPAFADVGHDAVYFVCRAIGGIDTRCAQLGGEQMPAAEDVERQIAVAVVVAPCRRHVCDMTK